MNGAKSSEPRRSRVRPSSRKTGDLRTGMDNGVFTRRLYKDVTRGNRVYAPPPNAVDESRKRCEEELRRWWKQADEQFTAMGFPNIVRQTEWLKGFNRLFALTKRGVVTTGQVNESVEDYLERDANLLVQKVTKLLMSRPSSTPQHTFPAIATFIDAVTQRGLVTPIPLFPGTLIGQFEGSVEAIDYDVVDYQHKVPVVDRYVIVMEYAGNKCVVNPVINLEGGVLDVYPGGLINEPRSDGRGLHGKVILPETDDPYTSAEEPAYRLRPDSETAKHSGRTTYKLDGLQWDVRPYYTDGEQTSTTVDEAWRLFEEGGGKRPKGGGGRKRPSTPSSRDDKLPDGWRLEERTVQPKRRKTSSSSPPPPSRPMEPHAAEIETGVPVPLADLDLPSDLQSKLVANVECVGAELPLCFYEENAKAVNGTSLWSLKRDTLHADMCVRREEVYRFCDTFVHTMQDVKPGADAYKPVPYVPPQPLVSENKTKEPLRDFDILHLKSNDDVFIGCERAVLVLPYTYNKEAFEMHTLLKSNGEKLNDLVVLRFFRSVCAWSVPIRQICFRMPDGRHRPYPWFRVGKLPIFPGDEILWVYNREATRTRGLMALTSDQLGPSWAHTLESFLEREEKRE